MPTAVELGVESVKDVLDQWGLAGEERGDEYYVLCPNPQHNESDPSCSVNLVTGLWFCFSCGSGGDLVRLGTVVTGLQPEAVARDLQPTTAEALLASVQRKLHNLLVQSQPRRPEKPRKLPGPYREGPLDYMLERGFKPETLERWGIRYCIQQELQGKKGPFTIRHSIAIPIRDHTGKINLWCYRATPHSPSWQPKYIYTDGVNVSEFWFGLQHHYSSPEVVIVEGALDAMWLDQMGVPALGLLGSQMVAHKILQLQRYKKVTIFADRDSSGAVMVGKIGALIGERMPLYVTRYKSWMPGKDAPEMHPVDVEIALARSIPWTSFRLQSNGV